MSDSSPLSSATVTLVDTNVFISVGNPGTSKYRRFRRSIRRAGVTLRVPARVANEIEDGGVTPALDRAREEGWARIADAPSVTHSEATRARDVARRTIAAKSPGKDEHDVEKADPVFAGLAVEYLLDGTTSDDVTVLTADRVAREAIATAMASLDYADQITILAVWDVIDDGDDDLTFI